MRQNIEQLWKRAGIIIGLTGLAGIMSTISIWYQYQTTLPRHPDVTAGRVYPLNVHGIVVYQTREERNRQMRFILQSRYLQ